MSHSDTRTRELVMYVNQSTFLIIISHHASIGHEVLYAVKKGYFIDKEKYTEDGSIVLELSL